MGIDERRDCAVCPITVRGRGVGSVAHLIARIGDAEAQTTLTVTAAGVRGVRVRYEELDIQQRAMISEDGSTLTINAASPSFARYSGERQEGWPGQDGLHFRTMLAEVVTTAVARWVIQNRRQQDSADSYRIFFEHMQLMEKWLPRVHAVLRQANELNVAA